MRVLCSTTAGTRGRNPGVWIGLLFEPRDMWIGLYLKRCNREQIVLYLCLMPMFPIFFEWWRE